MKKDVNRAEEVYIGVLAPHDIFQFDGSYFLILDDCFYIDGVPYVVAGCLGRSEKVSSAFVSSLFFFASDFRVLYGGEHYES